MVKVAILVPFHGGRGGTGGWRRTGTWARGGCTAVMRHTALRCKQNEAEAGDATAKHQHGKGWGTAISCGLRGTGEKAWRYDCSSLNVALAKMLEW